jgi:tRNA modification GTPase
MLDTRCSILDELAEGAAIEALRNASVVLFCVDISKSSWIEDIAIRRLIEPKVLIPVATKCDLLSEKLLANRINELNKLLSSEFLPTSTKTSVGIEQLRNTIDRRLTELALVTNSEAGITEQASGVALTARHRQTVTEVIQRVGEAIDELKADSDDVAAMMLRAAYQELSNIEQHHIDDQILDRIFSRFCIGK